MNAPVRIPASPYARRLARERGLSLSAIAGSGPDGRIVAVDVPLEQTSVPGTAGVPPALPEPPPVPATRQVPVQPAPAARATGAFAATIDLGLLTAFIAASGAGLALDCFFVKAAAQAAESHAEDVLWQAEAAKVTVPRAAGSSPTGISRLIREGGAAGTGKPLLLSCLGGTGIRPVSAALPAGIDLRLLVLAGEGAASAEALLVHDADAVPEADASGILAAFRDLIEAPLRLLV